MFKTFEEAMAADDESELGDDFDETESQYNQDDLVCFSKRNKKYNQ